MFRFTPRLLAPTTLASCTSRAVNLPLAYTSQDAVNNYFSELIDEKEKELQEIFDTLEEMYVTDYNSVVQRQRIWDIIHQIQLLEKNIVPDD
jgi:hypothetical protein